MHGVLTKIELEQDKRVMGKGPYWAELFHILID